MQEIYLMSQYKFLSNFVHFSVFRTKKWFLEVILLTRAQTECDWIKAYITINIAILRVRNSTSFLMMHIKNKMLISYYSISFPI